MHISEQAQAVLLLTSWFTKPTKGDPKPLTPMEWGRFALWLKEKDLAPEILLADANPSRRLAGWTDRSITLDRIGYLLGRAGALGLALEKWQRAGLWVMTRSDADYPSRLKKRLKFNAPPVLFGCGSRQLLDRGGIAVIGSRDATDADLAYTTRLGGTVASQGYSIVSGGARGVDEAAMLGALDKEGTVIGVLADSLLRTATSAKYRKGLMEKNLVLVSPFNPEAGFDVGNAMGRNKYIYCLADAAVVVATGKDKGGTWNGAVENIKEGWVPMWVKPHPDAESGNAALVGCGARWLPEGELDVGRLMMSEEAVATESASGKLFAAPQSDVATASRVEEPSPEPAYANAVPVAPPIPAPDATKQVADRGDTAALESLGLYDYFLLKLASETRSSPQTAVALQKKLDLNKTQLNEWLKRAVADGKAAKLGKPVRYQVVAETQRSLDL